MTRPTTVVPVPLNDTTISTKDGEAFQTPVRKPRKLRRRHHTSQHPSSSELENRSSSSSPRLLLYSRSLPRSASDARLRSSFEGFNEEEEEYLDLDLGEEDERSELNTKQQQQQQHIITKPSRTNKNMKLPALRKCKSDGTHGPSPRRKHHRHHILTQQQQQDDDEEQEETSSQASSTQSSTSRQRRHSHHKKITKRFTVKELRAYLADVSPTDDALLKACLKGDTGTVVALVSEGKIPLETTRDARGATPLIVAAERGHVETVLALYGLGAKVDAVDDFGSSPLCSAASVGRLEMCRTLLKIGADPHSHNKEGVDALTLAARQLAQTRGKEPKYTQCAELCRDLCLSSKSNYEPTKEEVGDPASWRMLREWLRAKGKQQDLYIPPAKVFNKGSSAVRRFFREEHDRTDVWAVLKVAMVIAFVVFDFASRDMVFTPSVVALYSFLYVCAYAL